MRPLFRNTVLDLAALIWPTECLGCGAPDRDLCDACVHTLRAAGEVLEGSAGSWPVFAAGRYSGVLRAVLIAFKHEGRHAVLGELARQLHGPLSAALASGCGPEPPLLVPVPSRRAQERRRGVRHVELLLRRTLRDAARHGTPLRRAPIVRALRPLPGRVGQVGLSAAKRLANARRVAVRTGAVRRIRDREIVLVDDIVTTGATALAACETLERSGARVLAVVCLGTVVRRDAERETAAALRPAGSDTHGLRTGLRKEWKPAPRTE